MVRETSTRLWIIWKHCVKIKYLRKKKWYRKYITIICSLSTFEESDIDDVPQYFVTVKTGCKESNNYDTLQYPDKCQYLK